jgi:hypothetical protein
MCKIKISDPILRRGLVGVFGRPRAADYQTLC